MKNVGVPDTPLSSALPTSSLTRWAYYASAQLVPEAFDVEAEIGRVLAEVARRQLALMCEQHVVHLPELPLGRGGFGGFGGELGARVDVVERQVSPHVPDVVAV